MEDPYPTGKYPDQKVWVWVLFPCLIIVAVNDRPAFFRGRVLSGFPPVKSAGLTRSSGLEEAGRRLLTKNLPPEYGVQLGNS